MSLGKRYRLELRGSGGNTIIEMYLELLKIKSCITPK